MINRFSRIPATVSFSDHFEDVEETDWFAPDVLAAVESGYIKGRTATHFEPDRSVKVADFTKMIFEANGINVDVVSGQTIVPDLPDAWYTNSVNYAVKNGLLQTSADGTVDPNRPISRGEAADILYKLKLAMSGSNTNFLLERSRAEMAQTDVYMVANKMNLAKRSSDLAMDLAEQAYFNDPKNSTVLRIAKLARSYEHLIQAIIDVIDGNDFAAIENAEIAIQKANEAIEVDESATNLAEHLKKLAQDLIDQVEE